jgi:hypothetical protein
MATPVAGVTDRVDAPGGLPTPLARDGMLPEVAERGVPAINAFRGPALAGGVRAHCHEDEV